MFEGGMRIPQIFRSNVPPCSHCGQPSKVTGVYYEGRKYLRYHVCEPCFDDPEKMKTLRAKIEERFARLTRQ
jgi:hypothetical protein